MHSTCAAEFVYLLFCRVGCLLLIRNSFDRLADFVLEDVLGRIDVVLLLRLEEELDLVGVVFFSHDDLLDHRLEQVAVELLDLTLFLDHAFDGRELQIDELLSLVLEGGQILFVLLDEDFWDFLRYVFGTAFLYWLF